MERTCASETDDLETKLNRKYERDMDELERQMKKASDEAQEKLTNTLTIKYTDEANQLRSELIE